MTKRFKVGDRAFYAGDCAIFKRPVELFENVKMAIVTEKKRKGGKTLYRVSVKGRFVKSAEGGKKGEAVLSYIWQKEKYWCTANDLIPEKEAWTMAIKQQKKYLKEALVEISKSIGKTNEWLDNVANTLVRIHRIEKKFGLK